MKKAFVGIAMITTLSVSVSILGAQDQASGEKTFKAKCAHCHGADAAGKPTMKSPTIKGKSAEDIQKAISTSPKHKSLKSLTPDDVKNVAAYLGTLK